MASIGPAVSCRGCGSVLDANGKCPNCGYRVETPYWKSPQFVLLVIGAHLIAGIAIANYNSHNTDRRNAADQAIQQLEKNADVVSMLGTPLIVEGELAGQVKEDETHWQEARLTFSLQGTRAKGIAKMVAGRTSKSSWQFSTLEVIVPSAKRRIDVVTGKLSDYDLSAYVPIHNKPAEVPEVFNGEVLRPAWDGQFPCVEGEISADKVRSAMTLCSMPLPSLHALPIDHFYVDLRTGAFVLEQTDLFLQDGITVPFTRSYSSMDWTHPNHRHAFGEQANHPYDIAPIGTRSPYTYLMLDLSNGDFLYFPRVSKGTSYNDAVYQHRETNSTFFKAVIGWDGDGWQTKLQDGSLIRFPESYNATNIAQGAPVEMRDGKGRVLLLQRDPKRNLQEIRTPGGRFIHFQYDGFDRIVRCEDDRKNWAAYRYNSQGFLTDVMHSDGKARHYTYVAHMLTWIRDEQGEVLVHNYYEDYKIVAQEIADGKTYQYHYNMGANNRYSEQTSVILPDHSYKTVVTGTIVSQHLKEEDRLD